MAQDRSAEISTTISVSCARCTTNTKVSVVAAGRRCDESDVTQDVLEPVAWVDWTTQALVNPVKKQGLAVTQTIEEQQAKTQKEFAHQPQITLTFTQKDCCP